MKILNLNFRDTGGGSVNAAVRLTQALNDAGISAELAVFERKSSLSFVIQLPAKHGFWMQKILKILNYIILFLLFKTKNKINHDLNFYSKIDIKFINNSDADIVHLHGLNDNFLSIKDISKIKKPLVWTLHDSWPCCGAESHPDVLANDSRYTKKYTRKNKPNTSKGIDVCKWTWRRKYKYLHNKKISFIAPSEWEKSILKSSSLFGSNYCEVIPNIVDKNVFFQRNAEQVKNILNLPKNKHIIGFGAAYGVDDFKSTKGTYYFLKALQQLKNTDKYFLLIFGPSSYSFTSRIHIPFFEAGYVHNDSILAMLYSVCDCFANPSLIESFGYTSLEAIFCGTPVVAFDIGGTRDVVKHKKTGYLAKCYDVKDFASGISYCIEQKNELRQNCTEDAHTNFNTGQLVRRYYDFYEKVLQDKV